MGKKEEDFVVGKGLTRAVISDWAEKPAAVKEEDDDLFRMCMFTYANIK